MKECICCKNTKPLEEFNKSSAAKDGKQAYCKECQRQKRRRCYYANRQQELNKRKEWRLTNKEKDNASHHRWKDKNPETYKESWKKHNLNRRRNVLLKISAELKCNRCGCDKFDLLEINHINGGGLKEVGRRNQIFISKILSGERQIDDLEILCKMCNILHYIELKFGKQPYTLDWNKNV